MEGPMQGAIMAVAAAGCVLVALFFAKVPGEGNWAGVVMAMLFAAMAGALVAVTVV